MAKTTTERRERFEAIAERAQAALAKDPRGYRWRLAMLALLGFSVIFGTLLALVVILGGSIWGAIASTAFLILLIKKKLIVFVAIFSWVLIKALWVRFHPPEGVRVSTDEAPRLHREVEAIREQLDVPSIHEIVLTQDFNAAMAQTPRLGMFGWPRNSLILGVPLLMSFGPDEARAVIAHELGHLSRNHNRFNGWIYRVRMTWYRILE